MKFGRGWNVCVCGEEGRGGEKRRGSENGGK